MKLCDIYVQPSRWEGFGITVTEAKVLSKPIITSDIPEFREQLRNGKTGLLCANENEMYASIKKMIEDVAEDSETVDQTLSRLMRYHNKTYIKILKHTVKC